MNSPRAARHAVQRDLQQPLRTAVAQDFVDSVAGVRELGERSRGHEDLRLPLQGRVSRFRTPDAKMQTQSCSNQGFANRRVLRGVVPRYGLAHDQGEAPKDVNAFEAQRMTALG